MNITMAKEIELQAETLPACLDVLASTAGAVSRPKGFILAGGCGDSAFAPAALGQFFRSLGLEICPTTAMDIAGYRVLRPSDTVLLSSISGGTRRTVEAARVARASGARVVAFTCNPDSELAKLADDTVVLPFTPVSRKTPHTLDYLVTVEALAVVALQWAGQSPHSIFPSLQRLSAWIESARQETTKVLDGVGAAARFFFVGSGPDLATASYGAAKLHEAGGLAAVSAETENFIHGMNFMLETSDVLIVVATNGLSRRRGIEVRSSYAELLASTWLVDGDPTLPTSPADYFSALISSTVKLQLFCLGLADRFQLSVDRPRAGRSHGHEHLRLQSLLMST
jgi:fructoselysine-6-P-deglycase FrlB-like protein